MDQTPYAPTFGKIALFAADTALVVLLASWCFAGEVVVTDGDSLKLDGERIRLWGIDAPEVGQKCERQGVSHDCGSTAREVALSLIGDTLPACEQVDTDRYGRTVARCTVGGLDLASMLVNAGWALDYERYSKGYYAGEQEQARRSGRGLWGGDFAPPWEWRD